MAINTQTERVTASDAADDTRTAGPRIWLVIGDKPGDNAQIDIIAQALGLPYEIRRVIPKPEYVFGKPRFRASLYHLDPDKSDRLEPPWPDLILTIGRRPSMAALWIQAQSGGHSKIILLGRPKRWMERFALIIVPAQYRMPEDPKVLHLNLPLMRNNEQVIDQAKSIWQSRFAELPKPLTALLVGGQTKPFRFDTDAASALLEKARQLRGTGSLYISTSRRTPPVVVRFFQNHLDDNIRLYCWSQDSSDNPYLGLLGLADQFIVTGDSISMMVEVARLGKPLSIYELPYQKGIGPQLQHILGNWLHGGKPERPRDRLLLMLGKILYKTGLVRYSRDLTALHRYLYQKSMAVPLGKQPGNTGALPENELDLVVSRVREVLSLIESNK